MANIERSLAHIEIIKDITPLEGYDRVALATILGWKVIINKEEFNIGDKCVYFEIDSLVNPSDERFSFMEKRKYKVKTLKMCRTISQGLAMPLSQFPELGDLEVGTDVTEKLKVTYYDPDDRQRKSSGIKIKDKSNILYKLYPNLFKKKFFKWLMKKKLGKKLIFFVFGGKIHYIEAKSKFPPRIVKTDEIRCENIPFILEGEKNKSKCYSVTEKLDGTSTTFFLEKYRGKYEFGVCSRNVRQLDPDQETYFTTTSGLVQNVYWEMAFKYSIEEKLIDIAEKTGAKFLYLQGETIGQKLQGNPYKLDDRRFYAFNLVVDDKRYENHELFKICDEYDIPHVPLVFMGCWLPDTMEELKEVATGNSQINRSVLREGLVYREFGNSQFSFKNVSREYLLKHS